MYRSKYCDETVLFKIGFLKQSCCCLLKFGGGFDQTLWHVELLHHHQWQILDWNLDFGIVLITFLLFGGYFHELLYIPLFMLIGKETNMDLTSTFYSFWTGSCWLFICHLLLTGSMMTMSFSVLPGQMISNASFGMLKTEENRTEDGGDDLMEVDICYVCRCHVESLKCTDRNSNLTSIPKLPSEVDRNMITEMWVTPVNRVSRQFLSLPFSLFFVSRFVTQCKIIKRNNNIIFNLIAFSKLDSVEYASLKS